MRLILSASLSSALLAACTQAAEFTHCRAVAWLSTRSVEILELGLTHDVTEQEFERRRRLEAALHDWNLNQRDDPSIADFERAGGWDREWAIAIDLPNAEREAIYSDCERRLGLQ